VDKIEECNKDKRQHGKKIKNKSKGSGNNQPN
jgi:hypothetical protein